MQSDKNYSSDETAELINASKVKGTAVYDSAGEHIGSIDDVVLTKASGDVAYALMSFGGFLGIGEKYHPLPWNALEYDTGMNGYVVNGAGKNFLGAPSYSRAELDQMGWSKATDTYYDSEQSRSWLDRSLPPVI